ncbi:MAG: MBOAT family O-acyltransferase, partial [Verrucomicrobiota bacterium]
IRKIWVTCSVVGNLTILGFFKYFNFFTESAATFLNWFGLPASPLTLEIILPIGISFYTFQSMSYTIDLYRKRIKEPAGLLDFFLYVGFFPQLVMGPIVRARTFLPQLLQPKVFSSVDVRLCLIWILIGFFKKTCVADFFDIYMTYYYAAPELWFAHLSWGLHALYFIQLYCDFSGYTDMAYGCAGLLGYRLGPNFSFPLFATNVQQFWQRWHISMGTWFRDYVYAPLRGNNRTFVSVAGSIFITFLLVGLWHGAGWKYVIQLGIYGTHMVIHLALINARKYKAGRIVFPVFLDLVALWISHCMANVFFRAPDFWTALSMFKSLFTPTPERYGEIDRGFIALMSLLLVVSIVHYGNYKKWWAEWWRRIPAWVFAAFLGIAWALVLAAKVQDYQPFIYFQF